MQKINQTDTAVVISGVTKSTFGSGRKIQRTPQYGSGDHENFHPSWDHEMLRFLPNA